ncbi:MAG: hypothetical protein R6V77_02765 [Candidatus Cloacimonadaceae bacterium]
MLPYKIKHIIIVTLILTAVLSLSAVALRWKPMTFDNPGTRRLLKTSTGNYYFYRSLPEKSMYLDIRDLTAVEIRAISKAPVKNPQFIIKSDNQRVVYDLKLIAVSDEYQIYEPIRITLPPGLTRLELICYYSSIYFRAFQPVTVQSKKPKVPSLKIIDSAGDYTLKRESHQSKYFGFNEKQSLTFQVNQGFPFTLYIRAQLKDREIPIVGLYEDGKLIKKITLSQKRTNTYSVEGIPHLTIGKREDFYAREKVMTYELKALSGHLFIAKPLIRKTK